LAAVGGDVAFPLGLCGTGLVRVVGCAVAVV
jgi:hypothetical protein